MEGPPYLGIYTVIYPVPDLGAAKTWYAKAFGTEPYFDEPFYVGFDVNGYELGLLPASDDSRADAAGSRTYWGVPDADQAFARLIEAGATESEPVTDVGGGIRVASVLDPWGNLIGVVENPNFRSHNE